MATLIIGFGAACCVTGAAVHLTGRARAGEDALGLAAFSLLLAGMVLTRS